MKRTKAKPSRSKTTKSTQQIEATEQKGDLLICDLWNNRTYSVHDMHVVNTDAKFHSAKTPAKCLQEAERAKKKMYLDAFLHQRQHLSTFATSVDGILGVEAAATLNRISIRLAKKCRQPYYRTFRYSKSRIVITLVQATHRYIRGSRVPA